MITQSFLNSLIDVDLETAKKKCSKKGLRALPVEDGTAITMIARPKTVVLWYSSDNTIVVAKAGDGLELYKDT